MTSPGGSGRFPSALTLLFVLCLALTGVGAVALVLASAELARSSQEVEDSLQLQNTLEKLQLTLVDAEAGERGFLVTHRPHFLEPYIEAVAKQAYYLGALERQVQGDATRMQSVRALRPMVDDLLRQLSATLTEADSAVGGAGPSLASMNSAKAAMDRVRTAMEGMRAYEQHSLAQRRLEVGQRTRYALVVLVVSNFASVLGLAGLYVGMLRHERQRRHGQAALARREQEYRNLFHGSPVGEAECDPQSGRILRANRRLCTMTGHDEARLQRTTLFDLLPRGNRLENARGYRDVVAGERELLRLEQPVTRADGTTFVAEMLVVAVSDEQGVVDRTSVIVQDVSARTARETEQAATMALLRGIARNTRNLVFAKDAEGRYAFANEALLGALERPLHEVLGRRDDELFPAVCAATLHDADERVLRSRAPTTTEETLVFAHEARAYIVNRAPYHDAGGTLLGVVCVATDITDLRSARPGVEMREGEGPRTAGLAR